MGLFDALFPKKKQQVKDTGYFQLLNAYVPIFQSWDGQLYENDLVRSAIDARARHISKLKIEFKGSAQPRLQTRMKKWPNRTQTWSQFLYRVSTILDMQNNVFILPEYDQYMERTGVITFLPERFELVVVDGVPWVRFYFAGGNTTAEELSNIGILTRHQYSNDLFGDSNNALDSTMQLIEIQNKGIEEAAKSSASYRFMARITNFTKGNALKKEREEFAKNNLSSDSNGGILLFPNTYDNIQQVKAQTYAVNPTEREAIQSNVYRYFGVNKEILENSATGDKMDAFFNGAIEPFEIQLHEVLTKWMFTEAEIGHGSSVVVSANRLQYMTTSEKVNMVKEIGALGTLQIDDIRELFNLEPFGGEKGSKVPIRGEYYFVGEDKPAGRVEETPPDDTEEEEPSETDDKTSDEDEENDDEGNEDNPGESLGRQTVPEK